MELIEIGKMGKPYGTEGLLRCFIEAVYLNDFLASAFLFVKINGQAVPFFIESAEGDANGVALAIEDIENRETAQELAGKEIFLRPEDMSVQPSENNLSEGLYEEWLGFRLKDLSQGEIGPITAFEELPQQVLAIVNYQGRSVMVPFHESRILEHDPTDKTILMDLPAGLLEL